jgi:hypothetical protein
MNRRSCGAVAPRSASPFTGPLSEAGALARARPVSVLVPVPFLLGASAGCASAGGASMANGFGRAGLAGSVSRVAAAGRAFEGAGVASAGVVWLGEGAAMLGIGCSGFGPRPI